MKTHIALMHDLSDDSILAKKGGLKKSFIFNESLEENVFCRNEEEQKNQQEQEKIRVMTQEAFKVDLNNLYNELIQEYTELKQSTLKVVV